MKKHLVPTLALCAFASLAIAALPEPAGISVALRASPGEHAAFALNARGVQVYVCKATSEQRYEWAFVAPEATLLEDGKVVGRHGAGPSWESTNDSSSVRGAVREKQDGGAGNIPWLLLAGTPSDGAGRFSGVTSIQRVATRGGVAPSAPCDASNAGREARVDYTADYYFYKRANATESPGRGIAY